MSDLESMIRSAAKSGRLNHISVGFINGKWSASYRGVENKDGRIAAHVDPVCAMIEAITGRKTLPPKTKKPSMDEDDLL